MHLSAGPLSTVTRSDRPRDLVDLWSEVVTTGLLGTDRRDPPVLPAGSLADLVDDALAPSPAARLAAIVSSLAVARRAGLVANPPVAPPQPPPADDRPMLPVAAARRWHHLATDWPVLEPEWLRVALGRGWRASPDVLVAMLRRARTGAATAAVLEFGGPLAHWLLEQLPETGRRGRSQSSAADDPLTAVPPELGIRFDLDPDDFSAYLVEGLRSGEFRSAHRGVLISTVVAMPARALPALVASFDAAAGSPEVASNHQAATLHAVLRDLAVTRLTMLRELAVPPPAPAAHP